MAIFFLKLFSAWVTADEVIIETTKVAVGTACKIPKIKTMCTVFIVVTHGATALV